MSETLSEMQLVDIAMSRPSTLIPDQHHLVTESTSRSVFEGSGMRQVHSSCNERDHVWDGDSACSSFNDPREQEENLGESRFPCLGVDDPFSESQRLLPDTLELNAPRKRGAPAASPDCHFTIAQGAPDTDFHWTHKYTLLKRDHLTSFLKGDGWKKTHEKVPSVSVSFLPFSITTSKSGKPEIRWTAEPGLPLATLSHTGTMKTWPGGRLTVTRYRQGAPGYTVATPGDVAANTGRTFFDSKYFGTGGQITRLERLPSEALLVEISDMGTAFVINESNASIWLDQGDHVSYRSPMDLPASLHFSQLQATLSA